MGAMGKVVFEVYSACKREASIKRELERAQSDPMPDWKRKQLKRALRKGYRLARAESKRLAGEN